jgi:hypothetical protein
MRTPDEAQVIDLMAALKASLAPQSPAARRAPKARAGLSLQERPRARRKAAS